MAPVKNALSPLGLYVASCGGLITGGILVSRGIRGPGGPDGFLVPVLLILLPLLFLRVSQPWIRGMVYPILFVLTASHSMRFTADPEAEIRNAHPGVEPDLCGWISGIDTPRYGKFRYRMRLAKTNGGVWAAEPFEALLECPRKWEGIAIGDQGIFRGKIESTLSLTNASYRAWLMHEGIAFRVKVPAEMEPAWIGKVGERLPPIRSPVFFNAVHHRMVEHMAAKFRTHIGAPADGLSLGLVTGMKSGLPREITDDFRQTGTLHVLAVSGSHAVVLAAMFYSLFRFVGMGRNAAMGLLLFGIFPPYLFLTAFQVSIVRTYIMAVALAVFEWMGREVKPQVILGLAFLVVALADPAQLAMVSFQLSFAAVWGMGMAMSFLKARGWTGGLVVYTAVSLGAQVFTAPLLLFHFGWINPLSFFYNTLILYTIPLSLIYSLILWLSPFEFLNPFLGHALALLNHGTYQLIHGFRVDGAIWKWEQGGGMAPVLLLAGAILGVAIAAKQVFRPKPPPKPRFSPWSDTEH